MILWRRKRTRKVFAAATVTEAGIVQDYLLEQGVDVQLVEGYMPYGQLAVHEVWVRREEDRDRALALVEKLYASDASDATPWRCGQCREENPGSFDLCWSCGAPHA